MCATTTTNPNKIAQLKNQRRLYKITYLTQCIDSQVYNITKLYLILSIKLCKTDIRCCSNKFIAELNLYKKIFKAYIALLITKILILIYLT